MSRRHVAMIVGALVAVFFDGMAAGYIFAVQVNRTAIAHKCPLPPPPAATICASQVR